MRCVCCEVAPYDCFKLGILEIMYSGRSAFDGRIESFTVSSSGTCSIENRDWQSLPGIGMLTVAIQDRALSSHRRSMASIICV